MNGLLDTVPIAALTQSQTLLELGLVAVLAAAAPLIGQVLRLPSILVLLALGFGAGAVGALDPNALLGEQLISAIVSIAVGIILFEAGLGLKLSKLTGSVARVSRRLVTLGILVTWAVGTVSAYLLFDLSFDVALVLGAVLVVSGPTVVGPLLDFIRPAKKVNLVLMWEGTLADPIGATLGGRRVQRRRCGACEGWTGGCAVPPERRGGRRLWRRRRGPDPDLGDVV
jgi:NhaP-type Na+/H+ or K+/H+ antiporter